MDFWLEMAITVILSTLKQLTKNPQKKTDIKRAMLKVRNTIDTVYGEDQDFA